MRCRYFCLGLYVILGMGNLLASPPKGVDWFKGKVEDAFKRAKTSRRPLFLYWGAVWCPPCIKMKKTVFSKPLFQEKIKKFVSVYFDGDQDRAQIWGEKLKFKGYPTLMILDADGKELMRLPVDASAERYVELLDTALRSGASSVGQILKNLETSSRQDWSMLAGHDWLHGRTLGLSSGERSAILKSLYQKVPKAYKEERYHFFLLYLFTSKEAADKLRSHAPFLEELLRDRSFIDKNFANVILKLPAIVLKVYKSGTSGERAMAQKRLLELAAAKGSNPEEKLLSLYPTLVFKKSNLPASFESKLLGVVEEIDKSLKDREERQNIMSTAIQLLVMAKMMDNARDYAVQEIKKSASPWYFMKVAADIEEKRGDAKAALEWSRKAWINATGANTRLAQGGGHLLKLLSLNSNDANTINQTFEKVLREILGREDAFSGRNGDVFKRLGQAVGKWENPKGRQQLWQNISKVCKGTCLEKMRGWGFEARSK